MAAELRQNDIPVWFNGTQRWMTGLTKRTTCDDVIYALLVNTGLHETDSTDNFAIFEKWREVERPLSARTKLLKVWWSWGEEQFNVQLSMRSLNDYFLPGESSLYMRSRRRHKRSNKNREKHARPCKCHNQGDYMENSRLRTMEQLVKLVIGQERQIQDLNDRLYDTDRLIDKHEARIHLNRVQQNGHDYVQNSYLNNHSSQSSTSSSSDSFSVNNFAIKDLKIIFPECGSHDIDEIVHVCDDIAHVERRILQEEAKINEISREIEKLTEVTGGRAEVEAEAEAAGAELEDARVEMIRAVTAHVTNEYNEREIDRKIDVCMGQLASRTEYLKQLSDEFCDPDMKISGLSCQSINSSSYHNNGRENSSESQYTGSSSSLSAKAYQVTKTDNQNMRSDSWQTSNHGTTLNYEQHDYNVNSKEFSYQHSVQNVRNCRISNDIPKEFSNTETYHSSRRTSLPDKDRWNHQNSKIGAICRDHAFGAPFSREGRSTFRFKDSQQQKLFSRSRSAERSFNEHRECQQVSEKCEAVFSSKNIYEKWVQSRDQTRPDQRQLSDRAIIDQYGLELGSDLNGHSLHFSKQNNRLLSSDSCFKMPSALSEIKRKRRLENGVSTITDQERKHWEENQQSREGENCTYGGGENSQERISAQIFSSDYKSNSKTCANWVDREKKEGSYGFSLCTSSDGKRDILCSNDTNPKVGYQFEKMSDLYKMKSRITDGFQNQDFIEDGRKPPNSDNSIDLINTTNKQTSDFNNFKTSEPEHNNRFSKVSMSSSNKSDCFENNRISSQQRGINFVHDSLVSSLVVPFEDKQTSQGQKNEMMNSQIGRQTLKDNAKGCEVTTEQGRKQNSLYDGSNNHKTYCVTSNNGIKPSLFSPRQQGISLSYNSSVTGAIERCGSCILKNSAICVHNINSTNHSHGAITDQHNKESRCNVYITKRCANKAGDVNGIRECFTNKNILTPELNQEIISSPSNVATVNMDTSRGALYHIVSNKINKPKVAPNSNHENDKREFTVLGSPMKQLLQKPPNIDRTISSDVDSGIYNDHNKGSSQTTQEHSNKELTSIPSKFSYHCVDQYYTPSSFSYNNLDLHNSPSSFSYNNSDLHNSPSSFNYTNGDHYKSQSKLSYSNTDKSRFKLDDYPGKKQSSTGELSVPSESNTENNHFKNTKYFLQQQNGLRTAKDRSNNDINKEMQNINNGNANHKFINFCNIHSANSSSSRLIFKNTINRENHNRDLFEPVHVKNISYGTGDFCSHNSNNNTNGNITTNNIVVGVRTKLDDINDSNSDTGLSSMHSDEAQHLETLV